MLPGLLGEWMDGIFLFCAEGFEDLDMIVHLS